jgi:hypothetical protein
MINAKEIYSNYIDEDGWVSIDDYQPIINAIGTVALQVDDDSYHGDSRILYDDGSKIGYLQFGWGSCSGCDALKACRNIDKAQELINKLEQDTKWFESKEVALNYFKTHDWEGDYSWYYDKQKVFIQKAIEYLKRGNA